MAALLRRIPVVVMEPNAVPGFTNRVIGRFVRRALVSFPETAKYFPAGRTEVTGLPVREEFFRIPPKPRSATLHILITGGSQGSRTLNQAARQSWPLFRKAGFAVSIVHQTGAAAFEAVRDEFVQSGLVGMVVPFITNMPDAFAAADLIICRVGTRGCGQALYSCAISLRGGRSSNAERRGVGAGRRSACGAGQRNKRGKVIRRGVGVSGR
jgi:UDP-N-acetylglucosamine--N-acetylmuramyl-(pentapeptide) pyrophosphoryl-undecaprenol N-acetylglucosamine transferase